MNMIVNYLNCNPVFNMLSSQANEAVTTVVVFGSMDPAVWSYLFISAFTSLFLNNVLFLRVYVCEYQILLLNYVCLMIILLLIIWNVALQSSICFPSSQQ